MNEIFVNACLWYLSPMYQCTMYPKSQEIVIAFWGRYGTINYHEKFAFWHIILKVLMIS